MAVQSAVCPTRAVCLFSSGAAPVPLPVDKAQLTRWMNFKLTGSPLDGTDSVLLLSSGQRLPSALSSQMRGEMLVIQMEEGHVRDM